MKSLLIVFLIFLFLPLLNAQEAEEESGVAVLQEESSELELPPGEFVYRPEGRRDPFVSLLRSRNVRAKRETLHGLAGLMIDEVDLSGIAFANGRFHVLLTGPDGRPYKVGLGTKLYDGEITHIDHGSVTFRKILTVALGGQRERTIIKRLNPQEE